MALHSYSRCWLHITWATLERRPLLSSDAASKVSAYLSGYAAELKLFVDKYGLQWRPDDA